MSRRIAANLRALALVSLCATTSALAAPTGMQESFETPEVSWRDAGGDGRYRIAVHQRTTQVAHTGNGSEYVATDVGSGGSYIYLSHDVGRAPVIPELVPSVWVRSDRPGVRLLARVVFPRTPDPRTGTPVSTLVAGTSSTREGAWEQLYLEDVPTLVSRQARLLRAQLKSAVDTHEAYVDRVLLNVFTGPGRSRVWIDDLEVGGHVQPGAQPAEQLPQAAAQPRSRVELNGSILSVDGRPFFPRFIEYQGEPLALLKELGFNGIKLARTPDRAMLDEAERLNLWLVCPPELPDGLRQVDTTSQLVADVGPEFNRVIVWHLGERLTGRDIGLMKRWSEQVRHADTQISRPIMCSPEAEIRAYSRFVDLLLMDRQPLGTSFELADYGTWLRERPQLARPGTPVWATVQTQPPAELVEQWRLLSGMQVGTGTCASEQIRLLVYASLAAGVRGVCFQSRTPLTTPDEATRVRAMTLQLLNLELHMIEPWGAAGSVVANVPGAMVNALPTNLGAKLVGAAKKTASKSGVLNPLKELPEVTGVVLQTDRAQLLLPVWTSPGGQYVAGQSSGNGVSFVIPGVPESNDVHEITPGGLRPMRHQRVAGGIRVTLDEFGMTSMVLLSQDPVVLANLVQRISQAGAQAARLERDLAALKLESTAAVDAQLAAVGHPAAEASKWISGAREELKACDGLLNTGDFRGAFASARRSMRPLGQLERAQWTAAIKPLPSPMVDPLATSFATLPGHWQLANQTRTGQWGRNRLAEGDFEDLDRMVWAGWQHFEHPQDGVRTEAELSAAAPKGGRYSLRLSAVAVDERAAAGLVETAPVWITSPAVPVQAGQWFRISGWIYVPEAIAGSLDGVTIFDSCGGEALAERIGEARHWKPFVLVRAATRAGSLKVTVALTGFGEVWLDNVTVEPFLPPGSPPEMIPAPTGDRSAVIRLPAIR